MLACAHERWGERELTGAVVSIIGLGHVGARLARLLHDRGCELLVADVDPRKRPAAEALGARWVEPQLAIRAGADVLAPCALGGTITAESVSKLHCDVVCGAANNQLAHDGLAHELAERDILYGPDFIANAGGLMNVYREIRGYDEETALRSARGIRDDDGRGPRPGPGGRDHTARRRPSARGRTARRRRRARLNPMADEVWVVRAGQVPYAYAREAQHALESARHAGEIPDLLLLLEHPPVYTKGRRSTEDELPMGESWYRMQGIDVTGTDRGGRVTYHGPGQLVGYPIVSLKPYGDDVHEYVRRMERVMIEALGEHGVEAGCIEGLTGVWTAGPRPDDPEAFAQGIEPARKIGSIGVHVNRAITTHGFAVNVRTTCSRSSGSCPAGSRPAA